MTQDDIHSSRPLGNVAFVGRQRELDELRAALEDALSGQGRLVMLVGEPGIGKTRTAQELAITAERRGAQVLWGRCHEQQGMPPYWPWVQAIRSYVRDCEPEHLRSVMGAGAADIAEIAPEVKEGLPDLKPPPPLESAEQARFRLFDSITTFLKNASQKQTLVIVLDNLHWADRPSLMLMEFLGQELEDSHLLVVGTYRDVDLSRHHPLSETLGELTRQRMFHRVALRGLGVEEVGRFIQATARIDPPRGFVELVHSHTEGNPLFVTEVVRMLEQEGELTATRLGKEGDWDFRIPEGVREVIGRRLNRLSEECNRSLTVAAVVGREFELRQLDLLIEDLSEDRLLEVLEEALSGHLIEELPRGPGRYQFTHALIQQTLMEEISTTRRVRLNARIVEVFEELYNDDLESHTVELAYHAGEAEAMIGPEKLVRYSLMAGEQALAAYANEEALVHFQRARAAKDGQPMDDETAALLFGLGRAQAPTAEVHQRQEAVENLRRAFDYYADQGDVPRALAIATFSLRPAGTTGSSQMLAQALELVPPDSHEAGRLLSRQALMLSVEIGDYGGAMEAFHRALSIAQRERDTALEAQTLARAANVEVFDARWQAGLEKSLKALEIARRIDSAFSGRYANFIAVRALYHMGDLESAKLHAEGFLAASDSLKERSWIANALWENAQLCRLEGNWQVARNFSDRSLALLPQDPFSLAVRAMLEYEMGDFTDGEAYLDRLLEAIRLVPDRTNYESSECTVAVTLIARISGQANLLGFAETQARRFLSAPYPTRAFTLWAKTCLALIAVQRGDVTLVGQQYPDIITQRGTMLAGGFVCADRVLSLLARTMGKLDDAVAHFEDALTFCRKAGYRPELAWTCHDYANMLVGTGLKAASTDAHQKAIYLLEEALAISTELGMRPLMERVNTLKAEIESRPVIASTYPDGLTEREVEVLRFIAAGKNNSEIAEELFISRHTVIRHVSNIFSKIGVTNRTEAATYATRHSLT